VVLLEVSMETVHRLVRTSSRAIHKAEGRMPVQPPTEVPVKMTGDYWLKKCTKGSVLTKEPRC
jgi:hypothetical protein